MKIKDVMSKDVQVARPADPIQEVAARMGAGDFGFLPVSDGTSLVGTITDRDIAVRGLGQGRPGAAPVSEVMTATVTTVLDSDDPKAALDLMASARIRRLPVLDRHGKLVGVVSLGDLSARVKERSVGETLETISRPG